MAPATVTVTIEDEGYFKKTFAFSQVLNLRKLLDLYRSRICEECSDPDLLEFWYETTKIQNGHTAKLLGLQDGDIIDVRITQHCTRGACPLLSEQTLPNVHYLALPRNTSALIQETDEQPAAPDRIALTIREINGFELVLRMKVDTPFIKIMEAFAAQIGREVKACPFLFEGKRILDDDTPAKLEMEDGDLIEVFYMTTAGGCIPA